MIIVPSARATSSAMAEITAPWADGNSADIRTKRLALGGCCAALPGAVTMAMRSPVSGSHTIPSERPKPSSKIQAAPHNDDRIRRYHGMPAIRLRERAEAASPMLRTQPSRSGTRRLSTGSGRTNRHGDESVPRVSRHRDAPDFSYPRVAGRVPEVCANETRNTQDSGAFEGGGGYNFRPKLNCRFPIRRLADRTGPAPPSTRPAQSGSGAIHLADEIALCDHQLRRALAHRLCARSVLVSVGSDARSGSSGSCWASPSLPGIRRDQRRCQRVAGAGIGSPRSDIRFRHIEVEGLDIDDVAAFPRGSRAPS